MNRHGMSQCIAVLLALLPCAPLITAQSASKALQSSGYSSYGGSSGSSGGVYPSAPQNPTDPQQCNNYRNQISRIYNQYDQQHTACLNSHQQDQSDPAGGAGPICSKPECQSLHDVLYGPQKVHADQEAEDCDKAVQQYQQEQEQAKQAAEKAKEEQQQRDEELKAAQQKQQQQQIANQENADNRAVAQNQSAANQVNAQTASLEDSSQQLKNQAAQSNQQAADLTQQGQQLQQQGVQLDSSQLQAMQSLSQLPQAAPASQFMANLPTASDPGMEAYMANAQRQAEAERQQQEIQSLQQGSGDYSPDGPDSQDSTTPQAVLPSDQTDPSSQAQKDWECLTDPNTSTAAWARCGMDYGMQKFKDRVINTKKIAVREFKKPFDDFTTGMSNFFSTDGNGDDAQ